ncbi:hypothetical protein KIPE111705_46510 [Kibdelosporangium persicum]
MLHHQDPACLVGPSGLLGQLRQRLGRLLPGFLVGEELLPRLGVLPGRLQIPGGEELFDGGVSGVQRGLCGAFDLRTTCTEHHGHPGAVHLGALLRALRDRGVPLFGDSPGESEEVDTIEIGAREHTVHFGPKVGASGAAQRLDRGPVLGRFPLFAFGGFAFGFPFAAVEERHDPGSPEVERCLGGVADFHVLGEFGVVGHQLTESWVTGVRDTGRAVPFLVRVGRHRPRGRRILSKTSRHGRSRLRGMHHTREHGERQRRRHRSSKKSHLCRSPWNS